MRKLDPPLQAPGGHLIAETADRLTWRGGPLPDGYYGQFQIRAMMPRDPGPVLWFDTTQRCQDGEIHWIQRPKPGQNPHALPEPAPFLKLTE